MMEMKDFEVSPSKNHGPSSMLGLEDVVGIQLLKKHIVGLSPQRWFFALSWCLVCTLAALAGSFVFSWKITVFGWVFCLVVPLLISIMVAMESVSDSMAPCSSSTHSSSDAETIDVVTSSVVRSEHYHSSRSSSKKKNAVENSPSKKKKESHDIPTPLVVGRGSIVQIQRNSAGVSYGYVVPRNLSFVEMVSFPIERFEDRFEIGVEVTFKTAGISKKRFGDKHKGKGEIISTQEAVEVEVVTAEASASGVSLLNKKTRVTSFEKAMLGLKNISPRQQAVDHIDLIEYAKELDIAQFE